MPPLPPRPKRPVLRCLRWCLVAFGVVALAYVAYSLIDAKFFETYEGWRLEHAVNNAKPSPTIALPRVSTALSPPRLEANHGPISVGTVLGRLEISRIGIAVIVAEGTGSRTLRRGVGHVPGTALPGELGNVGIAGHRDTFFRALRNIRQDDEITLTTMSESYRYQVDSVRIVGPDDTSVLRATGNSVLTLVTCYPFYFVGPSPQRFIVRAHQI